MDKKSLKKTIEEARSALLLKRRKNHEAEQLREQTSILALVDEHQKYQTKIQIAGEVFDWAKRFVVSKEYKEINKFIRDFGISRNTTEKKDIYGDCWGHDNTGDRIHGQVSCIYLLPNATFEYRATYKWMGAHAVRQLNNSEEMTNYLHSSYITRFRDHLIKGGVLDRLVREIERTGKHL
jgi:hypothetical protein